MNSSGIRRRPAFILPTLSNAFGQLYYTAHLYYTAAACAERFQKRSVAVPTRPLDHKRFQSPLLRGIGVCYTCGRSPLVPFNHREPQL